MPPLLEMAMEPGDISRSGRLPLNFNQDIAIPKPLEEATLKMRERLQLNDTSEEKSLRILQRQSEKTEADLSYFIRIEIIQGAEDSASYDDLRFEVFIIEFEPEVVVIQFVFEKPLMISIGSEPDYMRLRLLNPDIFSSQITGKTLEKGLEFERNIPR